VRALRERIQNVNGVLPVLLACALPLSTSVVTILAGLILLLWLVEGEYRYKAELIAANPVARAVLLYLAVLALGLLWSPDLRAGIDVLVARWKIAMFCVFLTLVIRRPRMFYMGGYLTGLTMAMLMTYLAWFGLLHYADVSEHHLTHKTFHVVYNPLLAFGIYLVLHEAIWRKGLVPGWRLALAGLAVIMIVDMFITEGRTGQLVFFVLMGLLLFQVLHKRRLVALFAVCILVPALFAAVYMASPVFKSRVDTARQEIATFAVNPNTSVGQRLQFWQNSWRIIRKHPLLGVGTGGFKSAYCRVNRKESPNCVATDNPHNQYVLVAAMLGIPGIASLLFIFATMFREAMRRQDHWQRLRMAFPIFFLVIMLTESYLKVYETGFFFALLGAVLYADLDKVLTCRESGP
jgi:O-antigen ligase